MEEAVDVTMGNASAETVVAYRSVLPRLTSRVMLDLRLWMLAFGVLIGLLFPFAMVFLGVPSQTAMTPAFFSACLIAGVGVAAINYLLAERVIGVRVRVLAKGMQRVEDPWSKQH